MTDDRLKQIQALAENIQKQIFVDMQALMACCPNCAYWNEPNELCTEPRNCPQQPQRPPAKYIAFGCPRFEQKVPF